MDPPHLHAEDLRLDDVGQTTLDLESTADHVLESNDCLLAFSEGSEHSEHDIGEKRILDHPEISLRDLLQDKAGEIAIARDMRPT